MKIFIDQGHNPEGVNAGAEGNGLREQDINYQVGIYLAELLNENGQFETKDKKKPKGVYEFIIDKKKAKYPPIEIPADLQEKLRKAKGQKAIEKASKDIEKYVMEQMHASWFDKLNAWRYLAMLSNPKTAIRNTVGNVAMMGASRIKDVVAAGVSKLPVARKYSCIRGE
jgi:hypothetical protein